ncbi:MAG: response regulator [Verrucomicrobiota bacterium]
MGKEKEMEEILVIDDEPMIRSMMETTLSSMGYAVTAAGSVGEAIEMLENDAAKFDALVTDFNLEDGTGLEVMQSAKSKTEDTPVILMTGSLLVTQEESLKSGFSAFFPKPFSCIEVGRKIDDLLGKAS